VKEVLFSSRIYISKKLKNKLLFYNLSDEVEAFSTMRGAELPYNVLQPHQTHDVNISIVDNPNISREELQGIDALITNIRGFAIGVRTADCIPVLLFDPVHKVVAAVHSGWKGTVRKISLLTIQKMTQSFGSNPSDIIAQIGPGIGPESFQIGEEVARSFSESGFPMERILHDLGEPSEKFDLPVATDITCQPSPMKGGLHIDLWEANKWMLESAGVEKTGVACVCTYIRNDLFYSARRETIKCPRIINSIKLL